jgi:hypothetical protein
MPVGRTGFARSLTDVDAVKFKSIVDEFVREVQTAHPSFD